MKLPTFVQIEPVGQCNLRCQMCAIQFRRDGPPYGPLAFMEFVKHLCHDFGESNLPTHYRPMRDFIQAQTLLEEDQQRIEHSFGAAQSTAKELRVDLRLPAIRRRQYLPSTPGSVRCTWPWSGAYVSYQGYAMPCCMVSTPDRINFGNIAEQGVEETWNSTSYQAFRDQLASDEPPEICRSCSLYAGTF